MLNEKKGRFTPAQKIIIAALAACLVWLLAQVPFLAEYLFARGVTRWIEGLISAITGIFPFSFYEIVAVLLILGAAALVLYICTHLSRARRKSLPLLLRRLAAAAAAVFFAFCLLYAPLYNRTGVSSALGLPDVQVTEENAYAAAEYYVERLNALADDFGRDGEGNILPEQSFAETAELLNARYDSLQTDYFSPYTVNPKAVALSVPMSYLGITGIYFPFTGEANVNVNIPAYEIPVTMAHEMAHAKGVARENEANIAAYVLCITAEDPYLQYSGLMNAAAVMLNSLPEEEYEELRSRLAPEILREYSNAGAHYAQYDGWIDSLSSFVNDLFLKSNGVPGGTRSYGQTAQSLVALYVKLCG